MKVPTSYDEDVPRTVFNSKSNEECLGTENKELGTSW